MRETPPNPDPYTLDRTLFLKFSHGIPTCILGSGEGHKAFTGASEDVLVILELKI